MSLTWSCGVEALTKETHVAFYCFPWTVLCRWEQLPSPVAAGRGWRVEKKGFLQNEGRIRGVWEGKSNCPGPSVNRGLLRTGVCLNTRQRGRPTAEHRTGELLVCILPVALVGKSGACVAVVLAGWPSVYFFSLKYRARLAIDTGPAGTLAAHIQAEK